MGTATGIAERLPGATAKQNAANVVIEATERYQVLLALDKTSTDALSATGLPAVGAAHPSYAALYVLERTPTQETNGKQWVVEVRYGKQKTSGTGYSSRTVLYSSWTETAELTADATTGAAILNSAGDPFDSAIQVPRKHPMWTIREHRSSLTVSTVMAYNGCVNSSEVTMPCGTKIPARCAMLDVEVTDGPGGGYDISWVVRRRVNKVLIGETLTDIGWDEGILEQGFFFLAEGISKLRYMETEVDPLTGSARLDADGSPIIRPSALPVLLDADGDQSGGVALFKRVATHPAAAWSI